jgi:hypothetical protein
MATNDYLTDLYGHLWTILLAHAPVADAVKPNNRIRFDQDRKNPIKDNWRDADFPELVLETGEMEDTAFTLAPTYAHGRTSFDPATQPWVEDLRPVYQLTVTHQNLDLAAAHLLELEILTALRRAGPKLGKSYVFQWGPARWSGRQITAARASNVSNANGSLRFVNVLLLPVVIRLNGAQLII